MARFNEAERMMGKMNKPGNTAPAAKSSGQAQATQIGNASADIARDQSCAAIDYSSRFLKNFTAEGGNRWNRFRDGVFVAYRHSLSASRRRHVASTRNHGTRQSGSRSSKPD